MPLAFRLMRRFVVIPLMVLCAACSGGGSSPATPTAPTPAPTALTGGSAILSVVSVSATSERTSTDLVYRTTFNLRETGGQLGVTVSSVGVRFGSGRSCLFDDTPMQSPHVNAGATIASRVLNCHEDLTRPLETQLTITVNHTDDRGVAGSVTGTSSITPPSAGPSPTPAPSPSPTPASFDGPWNLTVAISSCYRFTHTTSVTVH